MISQLDLVVGIMKLLDEQQPGMILKQHLNEAICKGATLIANAANEPDRPSHTGMGLTAWLASHDTGMSSKYLAGVITGSYMAEFAYPRDPSDFGRCYRLMRAVPEVRTLSLKMKELPAPWPQLYAEWLNLERLYEEEMPIGTAPKLYQRMQEIFKDAGIQ